jgi:RNA polymerase-binding transcription factor
MPQFNEMRVQLTEMQVQLSEKLERIVKNVTKEANSDWSEQAQERENDEVMDALGNEVRRELKLVNVALHRIKAGDYQYCADCGEDIAIERLKVLPFTQHCIKCASKRD